MKYVGSMEPHYGLRKLSIGVASVLLGMSIYGAVGHADPVNVSKNVSVDENVSDVNGGANDQAVVQATIVAPRSQNVEGEGTGKQQLQTASNVDSDQQLQMNNNATQNVVINDQQLQVNLASQENPKVQNEKIVFDHNFSQGTYDPETNTVSGSNIRGIVSWTYTASVDIDASLLSGTAPINLGTAPFTWQTTVNGKIVDSNMDCPALGLDNQPIYINGQQVGVWRWDHIDPNGTFKGIGMQHISVGNLLGQLNWSQDATQFMKVGYGNVVTVMHGVNGSTFTLIAPPIDRPFEVSDSQKYPYYDSLKNTNSAWNTLECRAFLKYIMSESAYDQFNSSHGKTVILDKEVKPFEQAFRLSSADATLIPSGSMELSLLAPSVGSDGTVFNDTISVQDHWYSFSNAGDGLNLKDLEKLPVNTKDAKMYYSRQSDNSLLFYEYIPADQFKTDLSRDALIKQFNSKPSVAIATDKNPQKAIENTADYLINKFHRNPSSLYTAFWNGSMDPSIITHVTTTYLDPSDGHIINQGNGSLGLPPKYSSEGQSTIKLHIINSTNGADLSQVKSFTDWPNKGKHAELDLPNIAGYQVVTNDPASVLSRLHLTGTAITVNTQADYPKENTIADYYIVMEPKTETATVNIVDDDENDKVLDSGQVSGKFNAGIVSDDVINAKLQKLLDSGLYTLESNDLEKGLTYKDGSQTVTIKLKHKLDSVQRHYRVIEDLPDGSQKVIIDLNATLYKDADAKYYNRQGALLDGSGKILKANNIKLTVGQWAFDNDNTAGVALIDKIAGYSYGMPDHLTDYMVGGVTGDIVAGNLVNRPNIKELAYLDLFVGGSSNGGPFLTLDPACTDKPLPSRDFHIVYTKNQYPVTINYYDLSGKQISSSTTAHIYLDQVDANALAPKGYVLLNGQDSKLTVSWDHNELDLLVAPVITRTKQQRTVQRLINVENDQGQVVKTVVQQVNFSRDVITDHANGKVTNSPWVAQGSNEFAEYIPTVLDGYVIDPVVSQVVSGDDQDIVVTVKYQAVNNQKLPKYIDVNGVGYDKVLDGYEVVKGQNLNGNGILIVKKPIPVATNQIEYVKRTIIITMPNGRTRKIVQRARKGSKFIQAHLPKLKGYRIEIDGNIDSMVANSDMLCNVKFMKI